MFSRAALSGDPRLIGLAGARSPAKFPSEASLSRWFWRAVTSALLAVALACQRRFNSFFLARLQIESVPLDFLDNVLLKDLTLEAPERVLNCFTVLNVDLGQRITSFMANDETFMLTVSRCPQAAAELRSKDGPDYIDVTVEGNGSDLVNLVKPVSLAARV
jgi:hypothetical protein